MRQTEMVPGHFKNGGDIPSKFVHEKEMICYKYEPGRVFRAGFEFLKRQFSEIGMEKRFMRMSWTIPEGSCILFIKYGRI